MAKFEKPKKGGGSNDGDEKSIFEQINEPKCLVCKHPNRERIDYMLAMRVPYKDLENEFGVPYRSFSNHAKKHLRYEDESIKRIIEYEASIAGENLEHGVRGAFLRRSTLDIGIKKIFDGITSGEIPLEAKDVVKMIEVREKLDANSASAQVEQYELQFNAFKEAVEEICSPKEMISILDVVKRKLQLVDRPALQPPED